jgi:UDP-glucose 4-epimerase
MKIALTGSSSYLAGVLLPLLEADPEIEQIIGIDLKPRPENFKKLQWVKRDVRDAQLDKDFQGCDTLVHMAFIVMPIRQEKEALEINIEGSKNVFRAAAKAGVRKIVYTSSCAAYGAWPDNPNLIKEDQPVRGMPDFYYSWSKAKVEEFLNEFEKEHREIIITRLRPPIFLGPNINNLMRDMVSSPVSVRMIDRDCKAQFAWDEDIAQAIHLAIRKNCPGAFNVSGDGCLSLEEIGQMLGKIALPITFRMAYIGAWLLWRLRILKWMSPGWVAVMASPIIISSEKAKTVMGWKPKYDTRAALARFIQEMRKIKQQEKRSN